MLRSWTIPAHTYTQKREEMFARTSKLSKSARKESWGLGRQRCRPRELTRITRLTRTFRREKSGHFRRPKASTCKGTTTRRRESVARRSGGGERRIGTRAFEVVADAVEVEIDDGRGVERDASWLLWNRRLPQKNLKQQITSGKRFPRFASSRLCARGSVIDFGRPLKKGSDLVRVSIRLRCKRRAESSATTVRGPFLAAQISFRTPPPDDTVQVGNDAIVLLPAHGLLAGGDLYVAVRYQCHGATNAS